jgi:hypothetical protein
VKGCHYRRHLKYSQEVAAGKAEVNQRLLRRRLYLLYTVLKLSDVARHINHVFAEDTYLSINRAEVARHIGSQLKGPAMFPRRALL